MSAMDLSSDHVVTIDMEVEPELPIDSIKKLYPHVNEDKSPLPRVLSRCKTPCCIKLTGDRLTATYNGDSERGICMTHTKHKIPVECGLFYFEVTVRSSYENIKMGVGLLGKGFKALYLLYGGRCEASNHSDSQYKWKNGDIIGVFVDISKLSCRFFINGQDIDKSFDILSPRIFPVIAFMRKGDSATINFGQNPFVYKEFENVLSDLHEAALKSLADIDLDTALPMNYHQVINKMVLSYLSHHAYADTAKAFADATNQELQEPLPSIAKRKEIITMVRGSQFAEAIALLKAHFPVCLQKHKKIEWKLMLRQFVRILRIAFALDVESRDLEMLQVIQYGKKIDALFQTLRLEGVITDADRKNQENVFALLAYDPPNMTMAGWNLSINETESLWSELMSALSVSLDGFERSDLEYFMANAGEKMHLLRMIADADMCRIGFDEIFGFGKE